MLARKKDLFTASRKPWTNFYRNNLGGIKKLILEQMTLVDRLEKNRSAQFQEKKKG